MSDAADVAQGREAWAAVHCATTYESWKAIAVAVGIGRQCSLRLANVNRPFGAKYARAFNAWLDENGFREMPYNLRVACCRLSDNIVEIEHFRLGLSAAERAAQNHPETIIRHWRRATRPEPRKAAVSNETTEKRPGKKQQVYHRGVHWHQDMVRRGALAMRDSGSSDWFRLARVCMEAAIRGAADLDLLMTDATPPLKAA
jgi:hypothetical protein